MTVTSSNIKMGVCDATYRGVDLGATKGGVEVSLTTKTVEIKADQSGDTPVKEVVIGTTCKVKVPMSETDLNKLINILPQGVATPAGGAVPTGRTASAAGNVGDGQIVIAGTTGGTPTIGMFMKFAGHATLYRLNAFNSTSGAAQFQPVNGATGLIAPVAAAEVVTFTPTAGSIEVRTGLNIDLSQTAGVLYLHPTGLSLSDSSQDFTVFLAAAQPNFTFKYDTTTERIYEVEFAGYADPTNNYRIAKFGA